MTKLHNRIEVLSGGTYYSDTRKYLIKTDSSKVDFFSSEDFTTATAYHFDIGELPRGMVLVTRVSTSSRFSNLFRNNLGETWTPIPAIQIVRARLAKDTEGNFHVVIKNP